MLPGGASPLYGQSPSSPRLLCDHRIQHALVHLGWTQGPQGMAFVFLSISLRIECLAKIQQVLAIERISMVGAFVHRAPHPTRYPLIHSGNIPRHTHQHLSTDKWGYHCSHRLTGSLGTWSHGSVPVITHVSPAWDTPKTAISLHPFQISLWPSRRPLRWLCTLLPAA